MGKADEDDAYSQIYPKTQLNGVWLFAQVAVSMEVLFAC